MKNSILFVVSYDGDFSIPLEIAGAIRKRGKQITPVAYYPSRDFSGNSFVNQVIHLRAAHPFSIRALRMAFRLIKKYKPSVIHTHHTWSAFVFFLLARLGCRKARLIKTEHTDHRFLSWGQQLVNLFTMSMAHKIICNSQATKHSFNRMEQWATRGKTLVCYNGVSINRIRKQKPGDKTADNEPNEHTIGWIGSFREAKDLPTLLKSFRLVLRRSGRPVQLQLIGDGPRRGAIRDTIQSLDLEQNVTLMGELSRTKVYQQLHAMDLFVLTSRWEGFCNALVESMAAEKAIVCSDLEVLREVGGEAVLFARPGDPGDFARQIIRILEDEELKQRLESDAAERARKFSLERCVDCYLDLYQQLTEPPA